MHGGWVFQEFKSVSDYVVISYQQHSYYDKFWTVFLAVICTDLKGRHPRPAESTERRCGSDYNLGFLCRARLSPFHFDTASQPGSANPSYVRFLCDHIVVRFLFPGPRMMCLLDHSPTTTRENVRPPAETGQDARATVIIRFVCKVCNPSSSAPSWAAGVAKPATAESCSTGWISSHPTLLGVLGSYVGPP